MIGLNWFWISLALTVPPPLALLVAYPFWRKNQPIFGNIVGTALIFGFGFAMIFREHVEIDLVVQACIDEGTVCWPQPSAFARYALYSFIALLEVFGVFSLSLVVERRLRSRDYAPEWR